MFDIISDLFGDVSNVFLKLETISDIKESSVLLYEINEKIFCKIGADMTNEIRKMMISVAERKLIEMCSKTFMHFETMVKLFMWESLGGKENPLIEYGSIGVLYNNCVTIINEIR